MLKATETKPTITAIRPSTTRPVLDATQSANPHQPMYWANSCIAGTPSHVAMYQFQ